MTKPGAIPNFRQSHHEARIYDLDFVDEVKVSGYGDVIMLRGPAYSTYTYDRCYNTYGENFRFGVLERYILTFFEREGEPSRWSPTLKNGTYSRKMPLGREIYFHRLRHLNAEIEDMRTNWVNAWGVWDTLNRANKAHAEMVSENRLTKHRKRVSEKENAFRKAISIRDAFVVEHGHNANKQEEHREENSC